MHQAIQKERRVEPALEPDRLHWGTAIEVLHTAGKTNYQNKHALLPVPQSEIDR